MDELLKKLLENEVLNEDTRAELSEQIEVFKKSLAEQVETSVRAELAEQWTIERDKLIDSIELNVSQFLDKEVESLREDIDSFRDLEAEFAERLLEDKRKVSESVGEELDILVTKLDGFLETKLYEELDVMKDEIAAAQENQFGRKVFEAFKKEFGSVFNDEASTSRQLSVTEDKLHDAEKRIMEMEQEKGRALREKTMDRVLSTLNGAKREQMKIILSNVETDRLQECYNLFIGRVLKEDSKPEVITPVIAEEVKPQEIVESSEVITGNEESLEQPEIIQESAVATARLQRLAGIR